MARWLDEWQVGEAAAAADREVLSTTTDCYSTARGCLVMLTVAVAVEPCILFDRFSIKAAYIAFKW